MTDETKKLIEELKGIVLDLYRNAGDLDQWIQHLESEAADKETDPMVLKIYIQTIRRYRTEIKHNKRFSSLDAREESVWERLIIESMKDEEKES